MATVQKIIFFLIIVLALLGFINSPTALLLGFTFTFFFKNPYSQYSQIAINYLLKIAVIGLGFGMFLKETLATSKNSFGLTFFSILLTVILGILLGKALKLDKKLSHLITSGTSICGGSAIAAISPVIKAEYKAISIALSVIFFLNAIALFVFPVAGHYFELTQNQFGVWCAIAIHDTSSVIGAAIDYGDEALRTATTVKLSRTLWIIPLSILSTFLFKTKGEKIKIPYFIIAFIAAILINSCHILPTTITESIVMISKRLLVITLFLVGSSLSISDLKSTGFKPILFALILWVFISVISLIFILY
ncbi:YeiH family protein [Aquimarina aquimarini]|uniref:YeiH family protein n=1 Tax=Aquimarina aquimarini TaxID=1191734 RepID=UPI000D55C307|nr:putative sulfate exporter family transporter [Aquimarina aquimarini]